MVAQRGKADAREFEIDRMRTEFDLREQERAEFLREWNVTRDLSMEQLKHDDEIVKKWIALDLALAACPDRHLGAPRASRPLVSSIPAGCTKRYSYDRTYSPYEQEWAIGAINRIGFRHPVGGYRRS